MSQDGLQELSFASYEDLQTRLLLMPRIEEEGRGAIATATTCSVHNYALVSIVDHAEDLLDEDFCQILSTLREVKSPFVCRFAPSPTTPSVSPSPSRADAATEEEKKDDSSVIDANDTTVVNGSIETHDDEAATATTAVSSAVKQLRCDVVDASGLVTAADPPSPSIVPSSSSSSTSSSGSSSNGPHKMQLSSPTWSDLSKWTTRMKQSSVEFSAVAASTAVQLAMAAKERAEANKSSSKAPEEAEEAITPVVSLFIHTSSGAWLPLPRAGSDASGELMLTNSSVISVRCSATEPCLGRDYTFQWYCLCNAGADQEWERLKGATNASFQPCATEVGHRLRCVATPKSADAEDTSSDNGIDATEVVCETPGKVSASDQLFNGSKQALFRGMSFGGLVGKDKASGRSFSIKIQTRSVKDGASESGTLLSAVTIYQVCGKTAEPMHPQNEPITGVTARVDHSSPKDFSLVFTRALPLSASMVAALATDDNRFMLQAPTRLTRESLLLALGIANFGGKPADLSSSTILFACPTDLHSPVVERDASCPLFAEHETVSVDASSTSTPPVSARRLATPERPSIRPEGNLASPLSNSSKSRVQERSGSLGSVSILSDSDESTRTEELEHEVSLLHEKLCRKNKVVAELQRQVAQSEALSTKKDEQVIEAAKALRRSELDKQNLQQSLRLAEKKAFALQESVKALEFGHKQQVETLNGTIASQSSKMAELEKTIRTLYNEKAVLAAGVEAREGKLSRMEELQRSFSEMSSRIQDEDVLREEIEEADRRYNGLLVDLERLKKSSADRETRIESLDKLNTKLSKDFESERKKNAAHHADTETLQLRIQKLVAERNSYKQKGDSLSKEMSRICRNGRSVRDVEKILVDEASLRQEVALLREQKRKALDDLDHYRTAYEQSRSAQHLAGLNDDTASILERNVELERLLAELSEYLQAKEMQLETLMEVNKAIQQEVKELTKSTMCKNLSRNDV